MTALARLDSTDAAVDWLRRCGARTLVADSRRLCLSDNEPQAFIAWPGWTQDARCFVRTALEAGARACLVEAQGAEAFGFDDERIGTLHGLKNAAGVVASDFMGVPSAQLKVLAITGTNGKTSTAWWIAQSLNLLGQRCGVVGTLGIGQPPGLVDTGLTTPDPVTFQSALKRFADEGFVACAIEASSIGLGEQRLAGTAVKVALLTNVTQDHLDYHTDMQSYWQAKAALFSWPGLSAAVLNIDDEQGAMLAVELAGGGVDVWTYSTRQDARLRASSVGYRDAGLCFDLREGGSVVQVRSALLGDYNVANLLAMMGGLRALGVPLQAAAAVCAQLTPAPGRMQSVSASASDPTVIVDYAHTPDALEKALLALRPITCDRGGKLWCVFGCGGRRDPSKRPLMGAVVERLADRRVVTSDNPRDEAPEEIISQILLGINRQADVSVIAGRREAIAYALNTADACDTILIAGKGHEDYQEVAGVKQPFSDQIVAQALLEQRSAAAVSRRGVT